MYKIKREQEKLYGKLLKVSYMFIYNLEKKMCNESCGDSGKKKKVKKESNGIFLSHVK